MHSWTITVIVILRICRYLAGMALLQVGNVSKTALLRSPDSLGTVLDENGSENEKLNPFNSPLRSCPSRARARAFHISFSLCSIFMATSSSIFRVPTPAFPLSEGILEAFSHDDVLGKRRPNGDLILRGNQQAFGATHGFPVLALVA